jgi:hypothetical protein
MRMGDPSHGVGLPLEARTRRLSLAHLGTKNLDGDESPQGGFPSEKELGGASFSERSIDGELRGQRVRDNSR